MADKKTEYQKQYNDLKLKYQAETDIAKKVAYEKAMKRLEPYVSGAVAKASDNVARASAATHALNNTTDVSMASKDPSIKKIVDADKKRDKAKKKDSSNQRNQADVYSAEAGMLRADADAQDALHMTGNQVKDASGNVVEAKPDAADDPSLQEPQKSELDIIRERINSGKATNEDLRKAYEYQKAGKWRFGPKANEWFKKLGFVKPVEQTATTPAPETKPKPVESTYSLPEAVKSGIVDEKEYSYWREKVKRSPRLNDTLNIKLKIPRNYRGELSFDGSGIRTNKMTKSIPYSRDNVKVIRQVLGTTAPDVPDVPSDSTQKNIIRALSSLKY